jgi:hypothetical protein
MGDVLKVFEINLANFRPVPNRWDQLILHKLRAIQLVKSPVESLEL